MIVGAGEGRIVGSCVGFGVGTEETVGDAEGAPKMIPSLTQKRYCPAP